MRLEVRYLLGLYYRFRKLVRYVMAMDKEGRRKWGGIGQVGCHLGYILYALRFTPYL